MSRKKAILELMFLAFGTALIIFVGFVVVSNYLRDGKPLKNKEAQQVVAQYTPVPEEKSEDEVELDDYKTIKYQRSKTIEEEIAKDVAKDLEKMEKEKKKNTKIKVEVINRSGTYKLAEQYREILEEAGMLASSSTGDSSKRVSTMIIERNDKKAGKIVREVINAGRIIKVTKTSYPYDVTLILGDDINP